MTNRFPRRGVYLGLLLLVGGSCFWIWNYLSPANRCRRYLNSAIAARIAGRNTEAEQFAASALELNPESFQAGMIAAESARATGETARALDWAAPFLASPNAEVRRQFNELIAPWAEELNRFDVAETAYRQLLAEAPDNANLVESLARLYASVL